MGSPSLPCGTRPYAAPDQGATRTKAAPYRKPRDAFAPSSLLMPKPITRYAAARTKTIPIKHAGVKSIPPPTSPQKIRRSANCPPRRRAFCDPRPSSEAEPWTGTLAEQAPLVFPQSRWGIRGLFTPELWGKRKCSTRTLLISLGSMVLPVRIELTTSPLPRALPAACRRIPRRA
jgi:hypothetical protein